MHVCQNSFTSKHFLKKYVNMFTHDCGVLDSMNTNQHQLLINPQATISNNLVLIILKLIIQPKQNLSKH